MLGVSCGDYRRHGAFAEYIAVPANILYRLPESLSFDHAAMIEAVSVAVHAVNLTPHALGDTAVVVGCGMIGQLTIQAARSAGFGRVIAIDVDEARLRMAAVAGAGVVLDSSACDAAAEVLAATEGRGADAVLEAVGATDPIRTAIACVRKGGAVTLIGNINPQVELPLQSIVTPANPSARIVRVGGRVPGLHRASCERRDPGGRPDQRAHFARSRRPRGSTGFIATRGTS